MSSRSSSPPILPPLRTSSQSSPVDYNFSRMMETQPPPVGHMALPPPSFLGPRFGNGPILPPPSQLTAPYFPPAPVPRTEQHRSQPSPPGQPTSNPGLPVASAPPSLPPQAHHPSTRRAGYQTPPNQRIGQAGSEYGPASLASPSDIHRYPPFSPRPERGPTSADASDHTDHPLPSSGSSMHKSQRARRQLDNYASSRAQDHGLNSRARDTAPSTIPAAFTASVSQDSNKRPYLKASSTTHEINVRQQPLAARACGFGERDRRVIDPPPIIELFVKDVSRSTSERDDIRYPFNVVHCSLWSDDGRCDVTGIPGPEGISTRRLMGTLVASPFYGKDENDREGCFFSFPDLSCRTPGRYRLRFVLMRLEPNNLQPGQFMPTITETESDVFTVFTPRDFPGMRASTPLTKALKKQGCAISVKKGNERTTGAGSGGSAGARSVNGADDDTDRDEIGSVSSSGQPKRRRRD